MTAASSLAKNQSFDSVESIIGELLDGFTRQTDLREDLTAKGVPLPAIQMLVELAQSGPESEFVSLKMKTLEIAQRKHGLKAVSETELDDSIERLVYLDEDTQFVRKMAKGMDLNPQAINMLTQIVLRNPGDRGKQVLTALLEYANACGVVVDGLRVVETKPKEEQSVLPDIHIAKPENRGLMQYKNVLFELAVGVVVTLTALSLLT